MIGVEPVVTIFLTTQLRKSLKDRGIVSEWDKYLLYVLYGAVALMMGGIFLEKEGLIGWVGHATLVWLISLPFTRPEFKENRSIINWVLPFAAVVIVSDLVRLISSDFYHEHKDFFENSVGFTLLWLFAMWLINRRQAKALETERIKRRNEEEQNRMMAAMKVNLESEVKQRTAELTNQKEELQLALSELRSTQAQLVQQEKMASLGELTAGIAHEIQNPLNFVNNFSEVSIELLDELKDEVLSKLPDDIKQEADDIINDITQNLTKINQHGKRADAIVKGMLQHSRTTTGKKEPTDINALADEYLRLSYHGLRAKDKMFNAGMKTSFDENIGKIDAIPQDLGRVLLNLFNNSFYSVAEKKKQNIAGYEPTVTVVTKKLPNAVEITVSDNGTGIPQKVLDKIYQPFFTTKPTGQGTGLGLSMSYDIITKGHGGDLKVETAEGEFARFVITIPDVKTN
jgi:signal transduction histidine kinase